MASLGLPGLAGFWGEFPAILSAYNPGNGLSVVTFRNIYGDSGAWNSACSRIFTLATPASSFGTPKEEFADDPAITDVTKHEWISWAPILALIVAIGIYPNLVFRVTDGAVDASLDDCLQVSASELTPEQAEALRV